MTLGPLEILVILVVALVVFGPKRLPEVGRQVGGALREIRKVQDNVRSEINAVLHAEEPKASTAYPTTSATSTATSTADREPDHDDPAAAEASGESTVGQLGPLEETEEPGGPAGPEPDAGFEGPSGSFS